jgi:hypothetical protein
VIKVMPESLLRIVKATQKFERGAGLCLSSSGGHMPTLKRMVQRFQGEKEIKFIVERRYDERRKRRQAVAIERRKDDRRRPKEELVEVVIST